MKKIFSVMLVLILSLSLVSACSKPAEKQDEKSKEANVEKASEGNASENEEVPTLKMYTVGSGMPENYDAWKKQVDEYIVPKIGAKVDVEVISWGEWDSRRNVIMTTGEDFDIIFGNANTFAKDVELGALADITDLVKNSKLPDLIPADYWKATTVEGKIYAIPTYKDSSITNYFVWNKDVLDKCGITEYEDLNSFEEAYETLKKITDMEGRPAYPLEQRGAYQLFDPYDGFSLGLKFIGVKYNDEDAKVINILNDETFLKELKVIRKMYQEGIINADAFTNTELSTPGLICQVGQGWPMAADTVWGPQRGCKAVVSRFSPTILMNDSVLGSINSVSVNCPHPEKAIALLELINTDTKLRDLFYYGEEGVDFAYEDGKVRRLQEDNPWKMAGYTQGTFFNVSPQVDVVKNQWDEVRKLNENAEPSVLLGFQLDRSKIENEIANVSSVWETYKSEILTGAKDPETAIAELNEQLKAAGLENLMNECQKQIDEFRKK